MKNAFDSSLEGPLIREEQPHGSLLVLNGCPYAGNIFTFKIGFTALMFFTLKIK
jgi:hypothetical protein